MTESVQGLHLQSSAQNIQGLSPTPKTQLFCMHQFLHVSQKYLPKLKR